MEAVVEVDNSGRTVDRLISIARQKCEFAHTAQGVAYARMKVGDHHEIYALATQQFKTWLTAEFYDAFAKGVPAGVLDEAVVTLSAYARSKGTVQTVHLRRAKLSEKYYIDLCDPDWRVVEVDEKGWRIVKHSPVWFTRTAKMSALPEPKKGGTFKSLLEVINVPDKYRILLLVWAIECFRPETDDVGLMSFGVQGAAKSTTQRSLKEVIDPMGSNLRSRPKSREDLFIAARNGLLLSYENLSDLSPDMQDALCTVLTGGEFTTRQLHTNGEEFEILVKNPVVLNGINNVVTRPDLLDRFICIELPELEPAKRKAGTVVRQRFDELKPTVFGAILTRFHMALKELPAVTKDKTLELPRMADFALLGEAVARSMKQKPGWFLRMYNRHRQVGVNHALDGDPVGAAIRSYVAKHKEPLSGTVGAIGEQLHKHWQEMPGMKTKNSIWPGSGKAIGNALHRLQPAMRLVGISIVFGPRKGDGYTCTIRKNAA